MKNSLMLYNFTPPILFYWTNTQRTELSDTVNKQHPEADPTLVTIKVAGARHVLAFTVQKHGGANTSQQQ